MSRGDFGECRFLDPAPLCRVRAAGMKPATRRRSNRSRDITRQTRRMGSSFDRFRIWDRREKRLCIWMQRIVINLFSRREFDQFAEVHHADTGRDVFDYSQSMRNEKVGQAESFLQVLQQVDDLGLHRNIER